MNNKLSLIILAAFVLQACLPKNVAVTETAPPQSPRDVPTWTPRPGETPFSLPSPTKSATATETATPLPPITATPEQITVSVSKGNINIRRGPSVYYNIVSVVNNGEKAIATARDRKGEWVYVESPRFPGNYGWLSLLTEYTAFKGNVDALPYKEAEPYVAAYIRNCTGHKMWVLPAYVELAKESAAPYNEEQLWPGVFEVYDMDVDPYKPFMEVTAKEGSQIDVIYDGNGTKSKCE